MSFTADQGTEEEAFAYLQTTSIPNITGTLIRAQTILRERGLTSLRDQVAALLDSLLREVNETAVQMAGLADGYIVRKIFETQSPNRPQTGNLAAHIRSEPGPLGSVRVALIEELDKLVNPNSDDYGPFWRAQEYGTGVEEGGFGGGGIDPQAGRVIKGTFEPSGTPPDAAQRGLGVGRDLAFISGGSNPGWGTIDEELPGRHFLRDGATEAGERYVQAMKAIESKYVRAMRKLTAELRRPSGGGTFIGRIEA